jgi:hypothetical protein
LRLIQNKDQCAYLSVTNGDNLYGSKVFERVLTVLETNRLPQHAILSPLDSRNYVEQGNNTNGKS